MAGAGSRRTHLARRKSRESRPSNLPRTKPPPARRGSYDRHAHFARRRRHFRPDVLPGGASRPRLRGRGRRRRARLHRQDAPVFRPEVLVLDPGILWGGDGVLARMREDVDLPAVPVIVLSEPGADGGAHSSPSTPVSSSRRTSGCSRRSSGGWSGTNSRTRTGCPTEETGIRLKRCAIYGES